MSCEVINPTAALPELGVGETHIYTTSNAYDELYEELDTKEGEKTLY